LPAREPTKPIHLECEERRLDERSVCVSIQATGTRVTEVLIKEGESFDQALKKFTRKVQQDGLLSEAKRRQHYEPPSVKRKRKADARERKARKARAKAAAMGY
jgi:small subunit ribosomal protein S21